MYDRHINSILTPDTLVGDRDQFFDFANSSRVSRRSSYYISSVSTKDATRDLPNLLRCFLPEAVEKPYDVKHVRHTGEITHAAALHNLENWLAEAVASADYGNDDQVVDIVNKCWPEHMQKRAPTVHQLLTKKLHCEDQIYSTKDKLNGIEITIREYHRYFSSHATSYSISWINSSGDTVTIENLPLPKNIKPTSENAKRFIQFVPEGILIVDENGNFIDASVINHPSDRLV